MASLTIVGAGISIGQITLEAIGHIRSASRVVALVENPIIFQWLKKQNPRTESLRRYYNESKLRAHTYEEIVDYVISLLRKGEHVCFVLYGHPGVFANPAHKLISRARTAQFSARMLPGISAEDCLFADLGLDPAQNGCQSYDATDFLLRNRKFDPSSALILWQVGVVGEKACPQKPSTGNIELLAKTLERAYSGAHKVVVYEAASYPCCDSVHKIVSLAKLCTAHVLPMSTLFVPPLPNRPASKTMINRLGISD